MKINITRRHLEIYITETATKALQAHKSIKKTGLTMNLEVLFTRESILILSLVVLNIILILLFHDQELVCVLLGILSVMAYFVLSHDSRQKKIRKAIVLLSVVFWGIIIESFIIYKTGAIKYFTTGENMNISLWLINCYMIFAISIVYLYEITPETLKQES